MIVSYRAPITEKSQEADPPPELAHAYRICPIIAKARRLEEEGAQLSAANGTLAELFFRMDEWICLARDPDEPPSLNEILHFNQAVSRYELALSRHVGAIVGALTSDEDLAVALAPHLSNIKEYSLDNADILLGAALGINHEVLQTGEGCQYHPTPVRHFQRALNAMKLSQGDIVFDFGGGAGVSTIQGAQFSPAHFVNLEIDSKLSRISREIQKWAAPTGRASTIEGDFFSGPLPAATHAFFFEPVEGKMALELPRRVASLGIDRVCCYSPFESVIDVRRAFSTSRDFECIGRSSAKDIYVYQRRGSSGDG